MRIGPKVNCCIGAEQSYGPGCCLPDALFRSNRAARLRNAPITWAAWGRNRKRRTPSLPPPHRPSQTRSSRFMIWRFRPREPIPAITLRHGRPTKCSRRRGTGRAAECFARSQRSGRECYFATLGAVPHRTGTCHADAADVCKAQRQ